MRSCQRNFVDLSEQEMEHYVNGRDDHRSLSYDITLLTTNIVVDHVTLRTVWKYFRYKSLHLRGSPKPSEIPERFQIHLDLHSLGSRYKVNNIMQMSLSLGSNADANSQNLNAQARRHPPQMKSLNRYRKVVGCPLNPPNCGAPPPSNFC